MAQPSHTSLAFVALAVGIYILKQYMNGPECTSKARLDGKVAIITGANTGVGKYNAEDFVRRGAKVYLACRSLERGNEAAKDILAKTGAGEDRLVVMQLDLASLESVRTFAASFKAKEKQLDILVNNAGIMFADGHKTVNGYEETFQVNHLGHFLLTKLLLDHLKAAPKSRIVNVSSKGHRWAHINFDDIMGEKNYNHFFAYAQSKLANILFTKELAKRLKGTGVTTYAVHPGAVITDLGRNVFIFKYAPLYYLGRAVTWPILKDTWYGAQTQICCCVSEDLEQETGKYYADCKETEPSKEAKDMETARKLWELSEKLIKSNVRTAKS